MIGLSIMNDGEDISKKCTEILAKLGPFFKPQQDKVTKLMKAFYENADLSAKWDRILKTSKEIISKNAILSDNTFYINFIQVTDSLVFFHYFVG